MLAGNVAKIESDTIKCILLAMTMFPMNSYMLQKHWLMRKLTPKKSGKKTA